MSNRFHYHCTCGKSLCRKQAITRHKCNPAEPRKDSEEPIIHSRVKREQEENIKTKTTLETKTDSSERNPNRENDKQKAPKNSKTDSSELNANRENDKQKAPENSKTDSSELNANRENNKQKPP